MTCARFTVPRSIALLPYYRLGEAERAYQLLLSLWQGAACLSYPMNNRLYFGGLPCVLGEEQNICHYWYRCKALFYWGTEINKKTIALVWCNTGICAQ